MPNLRIRWEDILDVPLRDWDDITNKPDKFPPDMTGVIEGPINIRGNLIVDNGKIKEEGELLEDKYLQKEETAFNSLLFNNKQVDHFKLKYNNDLFDSLESNTRVKGLVYHQDDTSNWEEYIIKIPLSATPWRKGSIGRKINSDREWVLEADSPLFSIEGSTGNIWTKGDLFINEGSKIRFDEVFETNINKNTGSKELIINIDSEELDSISFKKDNIDILTVEEGTIKVRNSISFNRTNGDLIYLSPVERINLGSETNTLFFRTSGNYRFYLGGDYESPEDSNLLLEYDNITESWRFYSDVYINNSKVLNEIEGDSRYISINKFGRWIYKDSISFWGQGEYTFALILVREDNWYYLPRLLPNLDNSIDPLANNIRRYKISITYSINSNNIYNPLDSGWERGELNGRLWIRILSSNNIELYKSAIPQENSNLFQSNTYYIELPIGIESYNNLSIQLGIFWSSNNSLWPNSNINGDNIQDNYLSYGSRVECSIEYISIDIYDVVE